MALTSGTRLGPYLVSDSIGAGGMGEVYRATDTTLGREVALKVLPDLVSSEAERLARFEREARTLASLNHPHIATVHGLERAGGTLALVMELVDGPTLADRIAAGPLAVDEALHVARQIADALEAAHAQGIVHRDLKPANVKVRSDGTVKVLDFGLAKALEPAAAVAGPVAATVGPTITSPAHTMHGVILGTAAYMSPEQARGKGVDARADIWAFGCVLYEMLTGRRAFGPSAVRRDERGATRASSGASPSAPAEPAPEDDDVSLTLARVLEREVDLEALPPGVPPRVRQAIAVCLRRDLRQRARAIGDVRLALDGAFESAAPPAPVASSSRGMWLRTVIALTAGAALASAALMPFVQRAEPLPPLTRFQVFAPPGSRLPLGTPAISADGRMLAYTVADPEGIARIHVRALDRTDSRVLPGTEGAVHPFWSPDGRAIAFATQSDGQLKRIELDAGLPRALTGVTAPWHGTWAGRTILMMAGPVASRIPADGGRAEPAAQTLAEADERQINYPEFLSDGQRFLVRVVTTPKSAIQLATLGSFARTLVLDDVTSAPLVTRTPDGRSYLLYMRAPDLLVHEFDEQSGTVRGDPRVIVTDIGQVANPPDSPDGWRLSRGHHRLSDGRRRDHRPDCLGEPGRRGDPCADARRVGDAPAAVARRDARRRAPLRRWGGERLGDGSAARHVHPPDLCRQRQRSGLVARRDAPGVSQDDGERRDVCHGCRRQRRAQADGCQRPTDVVVPRWMAPVPVGRQAPDDGRRSTGEAGGRRLRQRTVASGRVLAGWPVHRLHVGRIGPQRSVRPGDSTSTPADQPVDRRRRASSMARRRPGDLFRFGGR